MRSMVYIACGSMVMNLLSCFLIAAFSSSEKHEKNEGHPNNRGLGDNLNKKLIHVPN